jgi:histidinol-phosphate phosphatase family protein
VSTPSLRYSIVIPTIGRPSLYRLLDQLGRGTGPAPDLVVVADDRRFDGEGRPALRVESMPWPVAVVRTGGRGPAAARNAGWRTARSPWIAFLDDDVEVASDWAARLVADLLAADDDVGGSQATLVVPLPAGRRPTDWERNTAGLQDAAWITADMAYRRAALESVHGFDERFPRAFREDADLAVRVRSAGWRLSRGWRTTTHPVRPADRWVSVRVQAGNADDALLRAVHGRGWRTLAETGRGRFRRHLLTILATAAAVGLLAMGRRLLAALAGLGWLGLTGEFLYRRLAPGPRPGDSVFGDELRTMVVTSVLIPFAAVAHRLRGIARHGFSRPGWPEPIAAVLFDRDGTLVHDEPYNGDPAKVAVVPGAREVLDALRAAGVAVGVVSNQSGIGRGLLTASQVWAVNRRVDQELGPFDVWQICPHLPEDRCVCRKPLPGMVLRAAASLGVAPAQCAVIGDIEADVRAATAAGAIGVLVPTPATLADEIDRSELVAPDLRAAVAAALSSRRAGSGGQVGARTGDAGGAAA